MSPFTPILFAVALLAGCAGNPHNAGRIAPGTPQGEVLARAGQPTAVVPLPGGGQRLQYSMQPFGQQAWMVDVDAAGQVMRTRQVLTALELQRIQPGWTRSELLREFGPPARIDGVSSWDGPVFTYRWNDGSDMFYFVYLDRQDIVRRAHQGMEFVNAPDERD